MFCASIVSLFLRVRRDAISARRFNFFNAHAWALRKNFNSRMSPHGKKKKSSFSHLSHVFVVLFRFDMKRGKVNWHLFVLCIFYPTWGAKRFPYYWNILAESRLFLIYVNVNKDGRDNPNVHWDFSWRRGSESSSLAVIYLFCTYASRAPVCGMMYCVLMEQRFVKIKWKYSNDVERGGSQFVGGWKALLCELIRSLKL